MVAVINADVYSILGIHLEDRRIVRRPNLEVATKTLLYQQVKIFV